MLELLAVLCLAVVCGTIATLEFKQRANRRVKIAALLTFMHVIKAQKLIDDRKSFDNVRVKMLEAQAYLVEQGYETELRVVDQLTFEHENLALDISKLLLIENKPFMFKLTLNS